jgi:hypothetical protein
VQSIDLSLNSLSGPVPRALLGLDPPTMGLDDAALFRQHGARLCAHVSDADVANQALSLAKFTLDGLPIYTSLSVPAQADAVCATAGDFRALQASFGAASSVSWVGDLPAEAPVAMFEAGARAEAFFGACDLPEMVALQCAPSAPRNSRRSSHCNVLEQQSHQRIVAARCRRALQRARCMTGLAVSAEMSLFRAQVVTRAAVRRASLHLNAIDAGADCPQATLNYCLWPGVTCATNATSRPLDVTSIAIGDAEQYQASGVAAAAQAGGARSRTANAMFALPAEEASIVSLPEFARSGCAFR